MNRVPDFQTDADDIIVALYNGVFENPYWESFLGKIRERTLSNYVSLTFRRADAQYDDVKVIKSRNDEEYVEIKENVTEIVRRLSLPYTSLDVSRPYDLSEILDLDDAKNADYVAYLRSKGLANTVVMRVVVPDGGTCWISIGCSKSEYAAPIGDLLRKIAPHLGAAARALARLEHEQMRADIAARAVRQLNFGWLTFDARAQVIEIDPAMAALIANTRELRSCRPGSPFPIRRSRSFDLSEILRGFVERRSIKPRAVHLVDDPWLDMLIRPIDHRAVSGGTTPVAVGYVHGVGAASADRLGQLIELFGLTNSEARMALALSQGRNISEAADDLNFTYETARNYSKRIYAKTGTRGQADLVRIILASVISLS